MIKRGAEREMRERGGKEGINRKIEEMKKRDVRGKRGNERCGGDFHFDGREGVEVGILCYSKKNQYCN